MEGFIYGFLGAAALALFIAGIQGLRATGTPRQKPILMIIVALLTALNLLSWGTMPTPQSIDPETAAPITNK